jgi:hypothetical protein
MRFEMVQCDALLPGCEGQIELDNAPEGWIETTWADEHGNTLEDVCPSCADKLALEAEYDLSA